jgi:hypothetical protein
MEIFQACLNYYRAGIFAGMLSAPYNTFKPAAVNCKRISPIYYPIGDDLYNEMAGTGT